VTGRTQVIHRLTVGELDCVVISDGQSEPPFEPRLADIFSPESGVPEQELRAALGDEGSGRTTGTAAYNCLLVQTPAGLAIIDTGLGAGFLGYGAVIGAQVGKLGERLTEAGFSATDLAAVIFTHLHQDHVLGATAAGRITFPAATGYAHAAEIAYWPAADDLPADDPHLLTAREAIQLLGERLRPVEYDAELLPGVRTVDAAGHTPGHTAVLLESRGERLLCVGDTFHDPLQLGHPGFTTPWDHDRPRAVQSRQRLLARAADEDILVHAYHLPFPGLGYVRRHGSVFAWSPATAIS
jgi:glyoxylase-like metal-dependent hydrolase (beta-lactamase superfamily II)